MNASAEDPKLAKKLAKAAAKSAKKQARAQRAAPSSAAGHSPTERSADAAERQVALHRWRVVLAVIGAIIALITLLVMLLRD